MSLGGISGKALIERGFVSQQPRNSGNKVAYLCVLTPQGFGEKASLRRRFWGESSKSTVLRQEIRRLEGRLARWVY